MALDLAPSETGNTFVSGVSKTYIILVINYNIYTVFTLIFSIKINFRKIKNLGYNLCYVIELRSSSACLGYANWSVRSGI